jgi:hypothetical protein
MCSEHISLLVRYAKLRGFWEKLHKSKILLFWEIKTKTFPLSELVKIYWNFYLLSLHFHLLQHRNTVAVNVGSLLLQKKIGHKLFFLLEKYSSTGRKRYIFQHLLSSRLMRFLLEWYYPLMSTGLTCKMVTLTEMIHFGLLSFFLDSPHCRKGCQLHCREDNQHKCGICQPLQQARQAMDEREG